MPGKVLQKKTVDRSVYDLSIERINHLYDIFDHIAVSFSGGKDSTACLNLALEVAHERNRLPLDVVFFDEEAIPLQTVDYVRRVGERDDVNLRWLCVPTKLRNACSRRQHYWYPWAPEDEYRWVRELPPEAITELPGYMLDTPSKRLTQAECARLAYPAEVGTVGQILGIRASESLSRFRAVARREQDNYIVRFSPVRTRREYAAMDESYPAKMWRGGMHLAYPIYDWSTEDVWTAPAKFGWDYNRAYDALEMAGLSAHQQRCSPAYGTEPIRGLWTFHTCFPEIWDAMIDRVDGAATAARYAMTELYGYGAGNKQKPEHLTWEEWVTETLKKWPDHDRRKIAERIRDEIKRHYKKTSEPILDVQHYETGVSWPFLWMLANRADEMSRKQADAGLTEGNRAAKKDAYMAALEEYKSGIRRL